MLKEMHHILLTFISLLAFLLRGLSNSKEMKRKTVYFFPENERIKIIQIDFFKYLKHNWSNKSEFLKKNSKNDIF